MKFKIDENLPVEAGDRLRAANHDVLTVADEQLVGSPDSDIALICRSEDRVLITLDTDFGNSLNITMELPWSTCLKNLCWLGFPFLWP